MAACLVAAPGTASACVCAAAPDAPAELKRDIAAQIKASRAVFKGEVVGVDIFAVRVRVDKVWKGKLSGVVEFSSGARKGRDGSVSVSTCDYAFERGRRYVIFAYGKSDRSMSAWMCGYTAPDDLAADTERYLDELAPPRRRT